VNIVNKTAEETFPTVKDETPILSTHKCNYDPTFKETNPSMIEYAKLNNMLSCDREETDYLIYTKEK